MAAIFLSAFFSVFFYFGEQYLTIGFAILRQTVALYQNLVYFYANIENFVYEEYLGQMGLCQGKVVLQFILRPPGSIGRAGDGIWRVGGGIWRKMQISDNLDFKPENYLLGFDAGRSINTNISSVSGTF